MQKKSRSWLWLLFPIHKVLAGSVTPSSKASASTCPARTVNYLTHTLIPQCHKSSWPSPQNSTAQAPSTSTSESHESALTPEIYVGPSATASSSERNPSEKSSSHTSISQTQFTSVATDLPSGIQSANLDSETDSPLGTEKFLSFEEWKKQNLAKTGQSEDHIGNRVPAEQRKRPQNVNNVLDSIGDDAEIELNFGGFSADAPTNAEPTTWGKVVEQAPYASEDLQGGAPKVKPRSKDAGTTCKERFNYASFDCAANVLKTNPQASGSNAVLSENKDSYMLNQCSADNKFLILELCDDIAIDTIVLANYEFFSSIFHRFRVSVSDRYPVKLDKWKVLGTYEARNTREIQAFLVENPLIWARYLRIEFLSHFGNEFYCPISVVRVHGTTMLDDYKQQEEAGRTEEEDEPVSEDKREAADKGEALMPEAVAAPILAEKSERQAISTANSTEIPSSGTESQTKFVCPNHLRQYEASRVASIFRTAVPLCMPSEHDHAALITSTRMTQPVVTSTIAVQSQSPTNGSNTMESRTARKESIPSSTAPPSSVPSTSHSTSNTISSTFKQTSNGSSVSKSLESGSETQKSGSSSAQVPPANPTIQESFFKSVQKRLHMLESNSTLSLQYIEDQSRILRDAFTKVEQRQLTKTNGFLEYLNSTVLTELKDFRQQYDQIWQSTVIELEGQREQFQREVLAMNARLGMLAEEIVFQKRLSILQSILVLLCLALVLFSRGAGHNALELPIVQNMIARSQSFRFGSGADDSLSASPSATRPTSSWLSGKRSLSILRRHSRSDSEDSRAGHNSPTVDFTPPTPSLDTENGQEEPAIVPGENRKPPSPVPSVTALERPGTSPPALVSSKMNDSDFSQINKSFSNPPAEPVSPIRFLDASESLHSHSVGALVSESNFGEENG
ncbi:MAG: hypothetical protein Q9227_003030 [Pyrenula ochraceoflavens]